MGGPSPVSSLNSALAKQSARVMYSPVQQNQPVQTQEFNAPFQQQLGNDNGGDSALSGRNMAHLWQRLANTMGKILRWVLFLVPTFLVINMFGKDIRGRVGRGYRNVRGRIDNRIGENRVGNFASGVGNVAAMPFRFVGSVFRGAADLISGRA